jgi:hypothetical protein
VIYRKGSSHIPTRSIDRPSRKMESDDAGYEEENGVLLDEGMGLGGRRGELFRGAEKEVEGGGELDGDVKPKGKGSADRHHELK